MLGRKIDHLWGPQGQRKYLSPYVYFLDFFHLLGAKRRHTGPSTPAFVLAIFLIAMTKYLRGELRGEEGYLSWFIGSESLAHLVRQTCSQTLGDGDRQAKSFCTGRHK